MSQLSIKKLNAFGSAPRRDAVIAALTRFETTDGEICVVTDSEYVVLGAGGGGGGSTQMAPKWLGGLQWAVGKRKLVGQATRHPVLHGRQSAMGSSPITRGT